MRFLIAMGLMSIIFSSCEFSVKTKKQTDEKSISKIRNGIEIHSKGIKVGSAIGQSDRGDSEGVEINCKKILSIVAQLNLLWKVWRGCLH